MLLGGQSLHGLKEGVLAEVASIGWVGQIVLIIKLSRLDHFQSKSKLIRQCNGLLEFRSGQTRAVGQNSQRGISKNAMGGVGQKSGVDAARVGNQATSHLLEKGFQLLELFHGSLLP